MGWLRNMFKNESPPERRERFRRAAKQKIAARRGTSVSARGMVGSRGISPTRGSQLATTAAERMQQKRRLDTLEREFEAKLGPQFKEELQLLERLGKDVERKKAQFRIAFSLSVHEKELDDAATGMTVAMEKTARQLLAEEKYALLQQRKAAVGRLLEVKSTPIALQKLVRQFTAEMEKLQAEVQKIVSESKAKIGHLDVLRKAHSDEIVTLSKFNSVAQVILREIETIEKEEKKGLPGVEEVARQVAELLRAA